jgi:phospholipase/lecithinase/hemolysin
MTQVQTLPTYSAIYAFGDSLSDAGNLSIATKLLGATTPVSPPYYQERYGLVTGNVFSNGPIWAQDLSITLGLGTLAPSLAGGTDFAYGGAETGPTPQNQADPEIQAISLPAQIAQFQAVVQHPSASALYTLSIGSNDVLDILDDTSLSTQQQTTDVNDAVANEISGIDDLIDDGAKNLLVLDIPDLGKTPDVTHGLANGSDTPSATLDATASQLAADYDTDLISQLGSIASANTIDVHVVNAFQLIDDAVDDRAAYGLTNVTSPVWSGNYTSSSSGTLAVTETAAQDQYLFWDELHPTETGHQALAALAEQELLAGTVTCFASGTHIATERGEVMVQHLRAGDSVRVVGNGTVRIVWLGHRAVDCRRHPRPCDVWPIRVRAAAFGDRQPHCDLFLSPDHSVFIDDALIPVKFLINGSSIAQVPLNHVTYYHIELPVHSVLLAEGLPVESYLDTGNRAAFANGGRPVKLYPDFSSRVWDARGYAPLVVVGPKLDAARQRLNFRAATRTVARRTDAPAIRAA